MQIDLREAKTRLSELVDAAHEGQAITICKAGIAVACLVPLQPQRRRIRFGVMKRRIRIGAGFEAPLENDLIREFGK